MNILAGRYIVSWFITITAPALLCAQGPPVVYSVIETTAVNGSSQVELGSTGFVYNNSTLTHNPTYSFTGVNGGGVASTMNYMVTSSAQSSYGTLRASFNTSLTNAFYNSINPEYNPSTGVGVPTSVGGQSNASFTDSLTVSGGPGLTQIRLVFRLTGSLSQAGSTYSFAGGSVALWQNYAVGQSVIPGAQFNTTPGGTIDQLITTDPFPVTGGQADVTILLQAYTNWLIESGGTQYLADGSSVSSSINFFNTAQVIDVRGFDALGNSVTLNSAVGQSGTVYFTPIPEPVFGLLFPVSAVAFVFIRSTRGGKMGQVR